MPLGGRTLLCETILILWGAKSFTALEFISGNEYPRKSLDKRLAIGRRVATAAGMIPPFFFCANQEPCCTPLIKNTLLTIAATFAPKRVWQVTFCWQPARAVRIIAAPMLYPMSG